MTYGREKEKRMKEKKKVVIVHMISCEYKADEVEHNAILEPVFIIYLFMFSFNRVTRQKDLLHIRRENF